MQLSNFAEPTLISRPGADEPAKKRPICRYLADGFTLAQAVWLVKCDLDHELLFADPGYTQWLDELDKALSEGRQS